MLSREEVEAYCKEYYEPIYKYCMLFLVDREDTEDATQETFVAFSQKGHLIDKEHISPWLFRTAHNMVLRQCKKRALKTERECVFDEALLEASRRFTRFEEDMVSCYAERYVNEVYERLSEREKELFDLFSDNRLKTGDVACFLGIDPHTCSMRKLRLKEKCRDILKEILFY